MFSCRDVKVAMLARDEEQLLQKHLPQWRDIGDSFLIGLDSRNQDASATLAVSLLAPKKLQVYEFEFNGFGPSKTRLLEVGGSRIHDGCKFLRCFETHSCKNGL